MGSSAELTTKTSGTSRLKINPNLFLLLSNYYFLYNLKVDETKKTCELNSKIFGLCVC